MSWQSNSYIVAVRGICRTLHLNEWIASYFKADGYEAGYDSAFFDALRLGDVIWDVGANVGYYTKKFADKVGAQGAVIAYEPSPENFRHLELACSRSGNVTLHQCGLAQADGKLRLQQGKDELGATSRIVSTIQPGFEVEVRSGGSLIQSGVKPPNAIKIDVEGYELEVLEGFGDTLKSRELRVVGVEVHFGIFSERRMPNAPRRMETLLRRSGFRITWPDRSHLLAQRAS